MTSRAPSVPPVLPGFSYRYPLGVGGFADVFLYEQDRPRRSVAVKVLLQTLLDPQVLRRFNAEADVMASLGAHPSILTVHAAGISADGRPYLVMEHCPSVLIRRGDEASAPLTAERVLAVGVKIASALETAHRAGVLHRDIKPSNLLVTSYGAPVLADFGIATSLSAGANDGLWAMSVPWAAPEVLEEATPGSVASEIWSLGATLYTLLAARAPFETGTREADTRERQRKRILHDRPFPLPPSVPDRLASVVESTLRRRPDERPVSMLALARELQGAQAALGLPETPLELPRGEWAPEVAEGRFDDAGLRDAVVAAVPVATRRRRRFGRA